MSYKIQTLLLIILATLLTVVEFLLVLPNSQVSLVRKILGGTLIGLSNGGIVWLWFRVTRRKEER